MASTTPYRNSNFKTSDAFIGFHKDTPASVVFQATNLFRCAGGDVIMRQYVDSWGAQWSPEETMEDEKESGAWEESVSEPLAVFGQKFELLIKIN
jgi:hypothetical protein